MHNTRRLVHGLELIDGALESVLHHVANLKVLLADLVVGHAQDLLDILQSKAVALHSLEGLSTTNESLDIVGIDLQNGRAVCWVGGWKYKIRCSRDTVRTYTWGLERNIDAVKNRDK